MGHHTGPKVRLSRRLGVPIADTDKHRRLLDRGQPGRRRPSDPLEPGQAVSVPEPSRPFVARCAESAERIPVPGWLSVDQDQWQATVTRLPGFGDPGPPFDVDYTMVIEFYSR